MKLSSPYINRRELIIGAAASLALPALGKASDSLSIETNYAHLMRNYLDAFGLYVHPMRPIEDGSRIIRPNGRYFNQLHLAKMVEKPTVFNENEIYSLAKWCYRCAKWHRKKEIRFSPLLIPSKGMFDAQSVVGGDISIRILNVYDAYTDAAISRMDVLFEVI